MRTQRILGVDGLSRLQPHRCRNASRGHRLKMMGRSAGCIQTCGWRIWCRQLRTPRRNCGRGRWQWRHSVLDVVVVDFIAVIIVLTTVDVECRRIPGIRWLERHSEEIAAVHAVFCARQERLCPESSLVRDERKSKFVSDACNGSFFLLPYLALRFFTELMADNDVIALSQHTQLSSHASKLWVIWLVDKRRVFGFAKSNKLQRLSSRRVSVAHGLKRYGHLIACAGFSDSTRTRFGRRVR